MKASILAEIIAAKRARVAEAKTAADLDEMRELAESNRANGERRLSQRLNVSSGISVIAEFKRASPSKGIINADARPEETASRYANAGAAAISVLTEEDYFRGSLDDLKAIRRAVDIPILRKDFVFDKFQITETAAADADAILLIVAALEKDALISLYEHAISFGLDALVEVHDEDEMNIAADIGAKLIGVNNRNLNTFEVSLDVSRRLIEHAPSNALLISESGIANRNEMLELHALGYAGFLVGESLMRSASEHVGFGDLLQAELPDKVAEGSL